MAMGRHPARVFAGFAAAALALGAGPAMAQASEGYEFLKAVKEKDGEVVTAALQKPGSTIVNTRDIADGHSALHIVVERRDLMWTKFLLQYGANANVRDNKGVSPLVLAARLGFIEGVEALVKGGARVDEANSTGETPLIAAVHNRNAELVRVLLDSGANPDRADSSGRTARDYARLDGERSRMMLEIEKAEAKEEQQADGQGIDFSKYGPSIR